MGSGWCLGAIVEKIGRDRDFFFSWVAYRRLVGISGFDPCDQSQSRVVRRKSILEYRSTRRHSFLEDLRRLCRSILCSKWRLWRFCWIWSEEKEPIDPVESCTGSFHKEWYRSSVVNKEGAAWLLPEKGGAHLGNRDGAISGGNEEGSIGQSQWRVKHGTSVLLKDDRLN